MKTTTEVPAPPVTVSADAENFARARGLWTSFVTLKALILQGKVPLLGVDVDLVADAEVSGMRTIAFCIRTNADLQDVLHFDESIRGLAYDQLPEEHQIFFAVRFELI